MTRIGIDCRFAGTNTGLGRYTREVTRHLLQRKDDIFYVLFTHGREHAWIPKKTPASYKLHPTSSRHYSLSEQIFFPLALKTSRIDLLFAPHFNVPLFCPVPFVTTIHDLILHRYPNQASPFKRFSYEKVFRHAVTRSKAIIAVSNFTQEEILDAYGKPFRKKITVIPEAVDEKFHKQSAATCSAVLKKHDLRKPFFLYVGNAKQHKNVQTLIDAYASLETDETELVLVTSGPEVASLKLTAGVRILNNVSDDDLPCLYFYAACFVTASLYEGFGLPVLEAAASGCPVIVTHCGSLPEVAPPEAKIVDPTVEGIAEALRELPHPVERRALRTWAQVAEETAQVLRKTANEKS